MSRPQTPPSSVSPPSVVGTGFAAAAAPPPPPPPPPSSGTPSGGTQVPPPQPQSGYLNLLAHLSAQRKAESDLELAAIEQRRPSLKNSEATLITSGPPPYLPDIKEESATKRTQMWLAQLGRYRQKSFQDEMDRNHDELWEEQIAKVKQCPVRSPIEPIEITLEDDSTENATAAEEVRGGLKPKLEAGIPTPPAPVAPPAPTLAPPVRKLAPRGMIPLMMSALECYPPPRRPSSPPANAASTPAKENANLIRPATPVSPRASPRPPIRNVISIKTSAISRVENQPRTFSLNLEINNNNPISEVIADDERHHEQQQPQPRINRHIPVPVIPTSRGLAENPPPMKRRLLEIPEDDLVVASPVVPPSNAVRAGGVAEHDELLPTAAGQLDLEVKVNSPVASKTTTDGAAVPAKVEDSSVLKSLLMDRLPRKRPLSPIEAPKRPSISGDSDILRKRLLGLKTENPDVVLAGGPHPNPPTVAAAAAALAIKPRFQPPSATITSEHQVAVRHLVHQDGSSNPVDLTKEGQLPPHAGQLDLNVNVMNGAEFEPDVIQQRSASFVNKQHQQQQPPTKSYTQTSVLKHLLYRYTNSEVDDQAGKNCSSQLQQQH